MIFGLCDALTRCLAVALYRRPETEDNSMKHPRTWYVVADGGSARILQRRDSPENHDAYDTHLEFTSANIHKTTRDLGASAPGRGHESANPARHAAEPRVDLHEAEKRTFVAEIAEVLNIAGTKDEFDRLILVAPAHALSDLEKGLDGPTRAKVAHRLQKDLTNVPNGALSAHFESLTLV
jgi:protein required for attachment to host cells